MVARIRTGCTRAGGAGCRGSRRIRRPRRTCGGSSWSGWRGAILPGSRGSSTSVVCRRPSSADRNPHRSGETWTLVTVAKILENPRYTGRQVWNRVADDREHSHPTSGRPAQRANDRVDWVISADIAHAALVGEADFLLVQARRAARPTADGSVRRYHLSGLLVCGVCGRRLESHWGHGRAGYRCRHRYTSARSRPADAPRNAYLREDHLVDVIVEQLVREGHHVGVEPARVAAHLRDHRLTVTCDAHGVGPRPVSVV
ncbi:recombinase family protein [Saccharothrix deserti]|uniref:recombinase family protein n=1 Tax=Saccharothrix deserti TaxID=2593674 RepID=UPI003B75CC91